MAERFSRATMPGLGEAQAFPGAAIAFGMWNPFFAGAARMNAQAQEAFALMAGEWQEFMGRQFKKDCDLMQRISRNPTPDQLFAAYGDYWRSAADDYGKEVATMAKLMTETANKMMVTAQVAADEATEKEFSPRRTSYTLR